MVYHPYTKSNMADGRHLENRDNVISQTRILPIWMKFGRPTQNHSPMTTKWSESKPEVEI